MTETASSIRRFSSSHLAFKRDVEARVLEPLRNDPFRSKTVAALIEDGTAQRLVRTFHGDNAAAFVQLLAGACDAVGADKLRRLQRESNPAHLWLFNLAYDLHDNYRRIGVTNLAAPRSTVMPVVPTDPAAPFTGAGATGINPAHVGVPLFDQYRMLRGNEEIQRRYANPLGPVTEYLHKLTTEQRRRHGEILTQLPIVSGVPYSYAKLPSRMSVVEHAARIHNLHAELIAAFLLAESRDQSQLEDAKDYAAATSLLKLNTSIGLGQVNVGTARRDDLFSDLLSRDFRGRLTHDQLAFLLVSDEFNIFAAAKYIRKTADEGSRMKRHILRDTFEWFPKLNLSAYKLNSRLWPADNIMALASEYTSTAWDDEVSQAWGWFVYEAYLDIMPQAAASGPRLPELRERFRGYRESRRA